MSLESIPYGLQANEKKRSVLKKNQGEGEK